MLDFFHALRDPDSVFLVYALVTGILASIACGIVGTYVVVRASLHRRRPRALRLGGLGAAYYLERVHHWQVYNPIYGWQPLDPLHGAVVAALLAAMIIGLVSLRARQREDTIISALWAIGMAVGVLFVYLTPGYSQDLMSYLFGSILIVSPNDVWFLAVLDALIIAVALLFYKQFLAVCFDEEYARLRGLNVEFYYLLLLCLVRRSCCS